MSDSNGQEREVGGQGWRVLLVQPGSIEPLELAPRGELVLGPGAKIRAGGDGALEVEADSSSLQPTLLNDVQLSGVAGLRSGDQVRAGEVVALVQGISEPLFQPSSHRWSAESFAHRVAEGLASARARGEPGTLFLVQIAHPDRAELDEVVEAVASSAAGVAIGQLGPDTLQLWADAPSEESARRCLESLQSEGAILRTGVASFPEDARVQEALVDRALRRLWSTEGTQDELVVQDPLMVRLQGLLERVASEDAPVLLVGEAGVGKTRWALQIHQRSGRRTGPFTRASCTRMDAGRLESLLVEWGTGHGTIVLEQIERLDETAQRILAERWPSDARVIATTEKTDEVREPGGPLIPALAERLRRVTLWIPALRDRPSEILPLAMQALQQARAGLGRARMTLSHDARRALQQYPWPGNVRELRNAVRFAALAAESEEVRFENLPARVQRGPGVELEGGADLRSALKATEKDALLKVLGRTRWNVTAAAKELGLPRRTVVYRIARLGLKRPAR